MKKVLIFFIVMSLCFIFVSCGNNDDVTVPSGYKIASNESVPDYVLIVPNKWVVETQTGTTTAYLKDELSSAVIATLSATFTVPENADVTLDTYFDSYSEEFAKIFGDAAPEVSTTVLDGEPARRYVFSADFNGVEYTFWQEICMRQGRFYTLTFSAPTPYYDKFSSNMIDILNLFKFTK